MLVYYVVNAGGQSDAIQFAAEASADKFAIQHLRL